MQKSARKFPVLVVASAFLFIASLATEMLAADLPVVKLIATGGTIAMKIDPVSNAPVPAISGEDLVATVPEVAKVARIDVLNLANVPSGYMDPALWAQLQKAVVEALARPEVAGVIVSHGTDTLEETAYFLDLTVNSEKPIVLIGAQRNASEKDSDGPRNLLNAARICASPDARGKGAVTEALTKTTAALRAGTRMRHLRREVSAYLLREGALRSRRGVHLSRLPKNLMSLTVGTRLSAYEVLSLLAAAGPACARVRFVNDPRRGLTESDLRGRE